ncbi:MAG: ABC transporter ATP-binding protein [Myxococcales bacterium]|nr:ABC transporter ATP-binding protein [Myxococcales bacterium]
MESLSVRLACGHIVIKDVSLRCERGHITGLIGPNGAGKSSLIKGVLGLLRVSGLLQLDGDNVTEFSSIQRAKKLAYVPQQSRVEGDLMVQQVVDQGRFVHRSPMVRPSRLDREITSRSLEAMGLKLDPMRRFRELSHGEQQRVLLARALATEATTILLDEPTASLDVRQALVLHRHLHSLKVRGYCVVVVLHDLNEVKQLADHVVLLHRGKVERAGTADEVITRQPIIDVYGVELVERGGIVFSLPET